MKRNAIAIACAAVLAVALLLPAGLMGKLQPESAMRDKIALEVADPNASQQATAPEQQEQLVAEDDDPSDDSSDEPEYVPGVVLVGIADDASIDQVNERLQQLDFVSTKAVSEDDLLYGYAELELAEGVSVGDAMTRLQDEEFVAVSQPNYVYHLLDVDADSTDDAASANGTGQNMAAVSDSLAPAQSTDLTAQASGTDQYRNKQWGLDAIKAPQAWNKIKANHTVAVAVLDSGIDVDHPDFKDANNKTNIIGGYSVLQANVGGDTSNVDDKQGHGTHVAGIIAAGAENQIGVAGASYNANIMPVQVIQNDSVGTVTSKDAAAGVNYIVNNAVAYNVRVINISFGSTSDVSSTGTNDNLFLSALSSAHKADILVVCAAGNGGANGAYKCFPCDFDADAIGVISVEKQTNGSFTRASLSNYNKDGQIALMTKELSAPGGRNYSVSYGSAGYYIYSTTNDGRYGDKQGTSMATPFVSAAAALMYAADSSLTSSQVKDILCSTAQDLNVKENKSGTFDLQTGYGLINAEAAVNMVNSGVRISGARSALVGSTAQMSVHGGSGNWKWSSSDTRVATVSSSGLVTARSAGSTTIKATNGTTTLSHTFTVYSASMSGYGRMGVGSTCTFAITSSAPGGWKWESSNPSVLSINASTGVADAKKTGRATITATSTANSNWVVRSVEIQVVSSTVSGNSTVAVGNTTQLSMPGYSGVLWSTSNSSIAKVNSSTGVVTGVSPGTAVITARSFVTWANSINVNKQITVTAPISNCTVSLSSTSFTYTGASRTPTITVTYGNTLLKSGTDYSVTYRNSQGYVVTSPTAVGTYTVVVTGKGCYTGYNDKKTFAIKGQIASVVASPSSYSYTGEAITPTVIVTGSDGKTLSKSDYTLKAYSNVEPGNNAYVIATGQGNYTGSKTAEFSIEVRGRLMYRMYNPNSGEHFYTASSKERRGLVNAGWKYEGIGWTAPTTSKAPVYRLYSGSDHHYTISKNERDGLIKAGWKYEGIGWYSDDAKGVPLYRQYNPNVNPEARRNNSGSHNYTTSKSERNNLVRLGWKDEGVGWYGVK